MRVWKRFHRAFRTLYDSGDVIRTEQMEKKRESFGSRIGFILVSAGCAIGIGNVWKFPYVAGQNGGAVFVLFYLLFLVVMGLPVLTMELSIGRASGKTIVEDTKYSKRRAASGTFTAGSAFSEAACL